MTVEQIIQELVQDGEAEHHGVKGMKWGVRKRGYVKKGTSGGPAKPAPQQNSAQAPPKRTSSSGEGKPARIESKPISEMSNDELRGVLERVRMEQELKKFTSPAQNKPTDMQRYFKMAKDKTVEAVLSGGADALKNYTTKVIGQQLGKTLKTPAPKKAKK